MARRDYICCKSCGCKLVYDGYDNARDALEDNYGTRELICPDCLKKLEKQVEQLREALQLMVDTHDEGGWPSATVVIARKALEEK